MALSSEQIYDELNGEEAKKILLTRFLDLLDTVPEFQRHLTLPRVQMRLEIHLKIFGRRIPSLDLSSDLTLRMRKEPAEGVTLAKELVADDEVNADTGTPVPGTSFDGTGKPPDQIREENGLPVLELIKDRAGITQQRSAPAPPRTLGPKKLGGTVYAAVHTLERAGPVIAGNLEYLPGNEPITLGSSQPREKPEVGIKKDFRDAHRP